MDVDRLLVALKLVTAGVHGGELRDTLNSEVHFMASPLGPALVGAVRELSLLHPGVVVEAKDSAITVHYRLAPAVEPQIATALRPLLEGTPCTITHCKGRRFFEVVSKHVSKGPHSRRSMISHRFADASPS
jgi:trehalose 6-phosphate phosphatase